MHACSHQKCWLQADSDKYNLITDPGAVSQADEKQRRVQPAASFLGDLLLFACMASDHCTAASGYAAGRPSYLCCMHRLLRGMHGTAPHSPQASLPMLPPRHQSLSHRTGCTLQAMAGSNESTALHTGVQYVRRRQLRKLEWYQGGTLLSACHAATARANQGLAVVL
jgi:hypothetical protein